MNAVTLKASEFVQAPAEIAAVVTELGENKGIFTAKFLYESLPLDLYAKIIGLCSDEPHLKDLMIEAPSIGVLPLFHFTP